MEEEQEIQQESRFNIGVAKEIMRNQLWGDANRHSRLGMYKKWNEDLDCIWTALAADVKEDNFKEKQEEFDDFEIRMVNIGELDDYESQDFSKPSPKKIESRKKHYKILREKELFLRRLENSLGKGTVWKDNDEDGFD